MLSAIGPLGLGPEKGVRMSKRFVRLFTAIVVAVCAVSASAELKPRKVFPKPVREIIAAERDTRYATLKLVEGSGVRLRGGHLVVDPEAVTDRLRRSGIDPAMVGLRVAAVNALLAKNHVVVSRLFSRGEQELDDYRAAGERASGLELGDQNLFYMLIFPAADESMIDTLDELNRLDAVEQAAPMRKVTSPTGDKPPTTPLYTGDQGYLYAAPGGINVDGMSAAAGGTGEGIQIADIEYGWLVTHEDLPTPLSVLNNSSLFVNHGTSVLGELVGVDNGYGIRGIAYGASLRLVGHYDGTVSNVANAVDTASSLVNPGDVILMETQALCLASQSDCPSEYDLGVFTAVQNATATLRVVVEAAGNSSLDLDDPAFQGRFDPNQYDSGAIMAGGGVSIVDNLGRHSPEALSNFGARVDVQGWGDNVVTTGGGDLFNPNDPEQEYTAIFNGTSSAAPMVAGAAAVLQGVRKARQLPLLWSVQMRAAVQVGATPQGTGGHVGPLPNVKAAVAAIPITPTTVTATGSSGAVSVTWASVPGVSYELYRQTSATGAWNKIYSGSTPSFPDTSVSAGHTYLYKVLCVDGLGNASPYSNSELATTINYTDPTITSFSTLVKAKHIVEVRTAVNAICTFAGPALCASAPYSGNALDENYMKTQLIPAADFTSVKNNIVNLRSAIGASPAVFRETPASHGLIKRIHMEDLRNGAN